MSPEQARGKPVDKRADIWAFGAVFFEMLTGSKPFPGDDISQTLARVIDRDPDWDALPKTLPPALEISLRRCLQRDPTERVRDIGDVRLAMQGAFETGVDATDEQPAAPQLHVWQRPIPLAIAAVALAGITGLAVWSAMRPEPPRLVRFVVSPDAGELLHTAVTSPDVAISPDGVRIAYLTRSFGFGAEQLHVRPLDQHTSETLVAQGELNSPFFSPDGESVGFYDRRGGGGNQVLQRVSVRGGPVSTICELPGDLRGASWGADGTIVFAAGNTSGLWRVAAVGGELEPLTTPDADQGAIAHLWPQLLPGGEAVLFTIVANQLEESQIAVLSLDTGEQSVVLRGGSYPRYTSTGHLLYVSQGNLWAVGFDLDRLETIGVPVPVQEGVLTKNTQGAANFDVSGDGALIYVPGSMTLSQGERTLVWVDREGQEEAIPAPPADYESPRLSPDGRYIAVEVRNPQNIDVMVYDLQRDTLTRLTFDPSDDGYPLWSPDGQRVLFSSEHEGTAKVYSRTADGTGQAERLTTNEAFQIPQSFSPDGRSVVVQSGGNVELIGVGDESRAERLLETEFAEFYPQVSPDGRWITYSSNESGINEVYVRSFPNIDDGRWQISRDGGSESVWSHDGRELFFRRTGTVEMMVVAVDTEPTFNPGNPEMLFQAPYRSGLLGRNRPWDVAEDGRFLMIDDQLRDQTSFSQINVVLNWTEELKRLVPTN